MRKSFVFMLFAVSLVGCSRMAPLAPETFQESVSDAPFLLSGPDDPRLPGFMAEGPATPMEPSVAVGRRTRPRGDDPASLWNSLTTELGLAAKLPPPLMSRAYALTHIAINDAMIAAGDPRRGTLPSRTAGAAAAREVLVYLFPTAAERIDEIAASEAGPGRGANARAWAVGRAVGLIAVEHGRDDGSAIPFTGEIPTGPGLWTGTKPVLPLCGTWQCWVVTTGDEFQPEPPYAHGSPEDLLEVAEVLEVSLHRTPEQIAVVHKWADLPPPTIWNGMLLEQVASRRLGASASARAFAFLNIAMYDAFVSCWKSKYTYWTARPFHRTPELVTVITTPNFPSYTSGHSTVSGAAAEVMSELFPRESRFFHGEADEAAISRLWGGIHFTRDNLQGLAVGRRIGAKVVERMRHRVSAVAAR